MDCCTPDNRSYSARLTILRQPHHYVPAKKFFSKKCFMRFPVHTFVGPERLVCWQSGTRCCSGRSASWRSGGSRAKSCQTTCSHRPRPKVWPCREWRTAQSLGSKSCSSWGRSGFFSSLSKSMGCYGYSEAAKVISGHLSILELVQRSARAWDCEMEAWGKMS